MNPLRKNKIHPLPEQVLSALLMFATLLVLSSCASTKPSASSAKPLVMKAKKTNIPPASAEPDDDAGMVLGETSSKRKNLPLSGTRWQWEGNIEQESLNQPNNTADYSLSFKPSGWFDFHADCKQGSGIYEAKGGHIALAVINTKGSPCRAGSMANDFINSLGASRSFRLSLGKLYLDTKNNSKTMVFGQIP
jgi:heat shock protein HslJ